jgi:hypothetical protein
MTVAIYENVMEMLRHGESPMPFAFSAFPLMTIAYSIILTEGLFAYSNKYFMGCNFTVPISAVNITKVKAGRFNRTKATIEIGNKNGGRTKEITVRTSSDNFAIFKKMVDNQAARAAARLAARAAREANEEGETKEAREAKEAIEAQESKEVKVAKGAYVLKTPNYPKSVKKRQKR